MGTHRKCCCDITELDCRCPVYPTWCFGWQGIRGYLGETTTPTQTNGRWTPQWFTSPYYDSRTSLSWQIGLTLYTFNGLKLDGTSVYEKPPQGAVPGATYCAFNEPARTSVANNPAGSPDFPFRLPPKPSSSDNDWCIPYNYPAPEWIGTGGRPGNNNNEVTIIWPIVNAEQPQDFSDWDFEPGLNQYCCADFLIGEECTPGEEVGFKNADKLCLGFEIQGNSSLLEEMWSGLSGIGFGTNGVLGSLLGNATSTGRWAKRVYSENGGALKALRFFADPNVWGYNVPTTTAGGRGIQGPFRLMDGAAMRPSGTWNNHRAIFTHTDWGKENGIDPVFRDCYCNTSWPEAGSCTTQEVEVTIPAGYFCATGTLTTKWPVPLAGYPIGTGCLYAKSNTLLYTLYENPEPVFPFDRIDDSDVNTRYCDENCQCVLARSVNGGSCGQSQIAFFPGEARARVGCRGNYEFANGSFEPCDGYVFVTWYSELWALQECDCAIQPVDCNDCNIPNEPQPTPCEPPLGFAKLEPNSLRQIPGTNEATFILSVGDPSILQGPSENSSNEDSGSLVGPGGPGGGPGGGANCGSLDNPCICDRPPPECYCFGPVYDGQGANFCCCGGYSGLAEAGNCYDKNGDVFSGARPICKCYEEYCLGWPNSCGPICGYCPRCVPCCGGIGFTIISTLILFDIRSNGSGPKLSAMEPYNIRVYSGFSEEPINLDVEIKFKDQPNYTDPYDGQLRDFGCFDPVPINGGVGCFSLDSKDYNHPAAYCDYPANPNYRNQ
jgi:hypothetical protein